MEIKKYDQTQKLRDMEQSINGGGLNEINSNLNTPLEKTGLPKPGAGKKENNVIVNPEIPDEGDPTTKEEPIIY
jgi:hypothetical protein